MLKGWTMALALALVLSMNPTAADADMELYIGRNTIPAAQGEALARMLQTELEEPVTVTMQSEEGSFSQRMKDGNAPHMAILSADEVRKWVNEGMLTALDGIEEAIAEMPEAIVNVCMADEQVYALPLDIKDHAMAVRPALMEKIRMDYLLDERMHPAWYPTEVLQVLDELALDGGAGLELWPPEEEDTMCFESFLQGVSGSWFQGGDMHAGNVNQKTMEDALLWMEEMLRAELIGTAKSRNEALEHFLSAKTAIFIDWRQEDSQTYAKEIEEGSIKLLPYPSLTGMPFAAADVICFLTPNRGVEAESVLAGEMAALLASGSAAQEIPARRLNGANEMEWLMPMAVLDGGTTLRALFAQALGEILFGDMTAREAAQKIARAMTVTFP